MGDEVDIHTLFNCTVLVVGRDLLAGLNRSEILGIIGRVVEEDNTRETRDFLRECILKEPPSHVLLWWEKLAWIIVFVSMVVVATFGNTVVIWIVLGKQHPKSSSMRTGLF
ncbi:receptor [Nesidiocoris tenuis]|uniref:Receptor n=1 Tax=Nesidiocoris tenuis TaxID=355587 RepID=A0ABN7AI62_9HEMI|nr:receptor [Nesidiocoris tenuis]